MRNTRPLGALKPIMRAASIALLAATAVLLPAGPAAAVGPGSLDRSFGTQGTATVQLGASVSANDFAMAPDGSFTVAGSVRDQSGRDQFMLARVLADGRLDSTFGAGGVVRAQVGRGEAPESSANGLVLEPDGGVVAVGRAAYAERRDEVAAMRVDRTGRIEWTVTHQLGTSGVNGDPSSDGRAVTRQADGKVVVAGGASTDYVEELAIARLDPTDGSLDPSFADRGYVIEEQRRQGLTTASFIEVNAIVALPSSSIIAGGGVEANRTPYHTPILTRYSATGQRESGDPQTFSPLSYFSALVTKSDGTVLAAGRRRGEVFAVDSLLEFPAFARLTLATKPDASFGGGDGATFAPVGGDRQTPSSVAVQSDGRAVGTVGDRVVRLLDDGATDESFGARAVSDGTRLLSAAGVGVRSDGRIVVAGAPLGPNGKAVPGDDRIFVTRLLGGTAPGRITSAGRAIVRRGIARLVLTCRAPRGATGCAGSVRLTPPGGRGRALGRADFVAAPGARRSVRFRLTGAVRRRLARNHRRLRTRVQAISRTGALTQRRVLLVGR